MIKVNRSTMASPICISFIVLSAMPSTMVRVIHKLPRNLFTMSERVYHNVIVSSIKNGA